jgi:hypothetical protein
LSRIFDRYTQKAKEILSSNWTGSFTKPSPALYPHQWNWDTGFIAIGKAHYDQPGAMAELDSLFSAQWKNGMLPQIVFDPDNLGHYFPEPDFWQTERSPHAPPTKLTSGITMPPVHAIAVEEIWENAKNKRAARLFLERIYPQLISLHEYLYRERDPDGRGLVYIRHPWESGIDNSPAWDQPLRAMSVNSETLPPYSRRDLDHVSPEMRPSDDDYDRYVFLVDLFRRLDYDEKSIREECPFLILDPLFNSILCRANQSLIRLAGVLEEDPSLPREWAALTSEGIRETLWCPEKNYFYPFNLVEGDLVREDTSSGFLPLYAGAANQDQARLLYERLDSLSFCQLLQGNCYTVPNYDTQAEGFDSSNYWRGPVWININWMLADGLSRYGFTLKADSLKRDLLQLPIRFGFYEYFDSFSGQGYGSGNFSWTAALFIDLVHESYRKKNADNFVFNAFRSVSAPRQTLNAGVRQPSCSMDELAEELMKSISEMRDRFYDTSRGLVDYQTLGQSPAFDQYRTLTNGLRHFDPGTLTSNEKKLAFWINLYNTIVVDGIVTTGVKRSVLEVPGFFRRIRYDIGGRLFSPDTMEHGIMRDNARPWRRPLPPFMPWDSRRRWTVDKVDPRIHFALVCGSRSCAPIDYYDPTLIDSQLDQAARSFVNSSEVMIFPDENRILLSEIFRWYESDFGGHRGVLRFICDYLVDDDIANTLSKKGDDMVFEYLFYDWDLNRWGK